MFVELIGRVNWVLICIVHAPCGVIAWFFDILSFLLLIFFCTWHAFIVYRRLCIIYLLWLLIRRRPHTTSFYSTTLLSFFFYTVRTINSSTNFDNRPRGNSELLEPLLSPPSPISKHSRRKKAVKCHCVFLEDDMTPNREFSTDFSRARCLSSICFSLDTSWTR